MDCTARDKKYEHFTGRLMAALTTFTAVIVAAPAPAQIGDLTEIVVTARSVMNAERAGDGRRLHRTDDQVGGN
jgi:hypothetical protein